MSESARWLLPAFLGPLVALAAVATLFVIFHVPPGERLQTWSILMTFGTMFGGIQSVALVGVDAAAASMRFRRLPIGLRAWASAGCAPLLALLLAVLIPLPFDSHPWLALFAAATMAAVPLRLAFGPRWRAP